MNIKFKKEYPNHKNRLKKKLAAAEERAVATRIPRPCIVTYEHHKAILGSFTLTSLALS
jgi:hypothetical protein